MKKIIYFLLIALLFSTMNFTILAQNKQPKQTTAKDSFALKNKKNSHKDVKNEDNDKLLLEETPALKRIYPTLDIDAEIVRFKESNPNYKEMGNIANEIFTWCYSASSLQRVC